MKVKELIAALHNADPEAVVLVEDEQTNFHETGVRAGVIDLVELIPTGQGRVKPYMAWCARVDACGQPILREDSFTSHSCIVFAASEYTHQWTAPLRGVAS